MNQKHIYKKFVMNTKRILIHYFWNRVDQKNGSFIKVHTVILTQFGVSIFII